MKTNHTPGPLSRLLAQAARAPDGNGPIAPEFHQQWQTFWKAQQEGLVTDTFPARITEKGRQTAKAEGGAK